MRIFGFAGYSGAGKTTLIEQLIPRFCRMGLRVSLIKHAHHEFDIDKPGKDSFRHREAGAGEVMVVSTRRWALMHELRNEPEPSLDEQISHMSPCDLLLVEGFKSSHIPKMEIYRSALGKARLQCEGMNIVALASDGASNVQEAVAVPQLDLNNPDEVAGFILEYFRIDPRQVVFPARTVASTMPTMQVAATPANVALSHRFL